MKRELIGFIAGCVFTAAALIGGPALADAYSQSINVQVDSVKVTSAGKNGTEPTILWNNKTYIPMRETLENANCRVTYYDATKSVVVNNRYEKCGDLLSCNGKTLSRDDAIYYWDKDNNMTFYIKANYLIGNCGLNIGTVGETYGKTDLPKFSKNQSSSTNENVSYVAESKFSIAAQPMLAYQNELVPASDTVVFKDGGTVICYINPEYLAKKYNMNVVVSEFNGLFYPNFVNTSNTIAQPSVPKNNNAANSSTVLNQANVYYIYSDDGKNQYLGKITTNSFDAESIWNTVSKYGNNVNINNIWNNVGTYGNSTSMYSTSATLATHPPKIYDSNGNFVAYLTENTAKYPRYTKSQLTVMFTK